ncbi:dihydroorotase [uncultured archaeon]|nr:dihydroorotase [uncultured archaeon]
MTDVAISGRFYYQGRFRDLTVGVTNGIISEIKKNLKAQVHYSVEGGILPGSTDTHVHFRDPGETAKEDFSTGSAAAVYGGTTTVLDMPNNRLPIVDYDRFYDKKAAIRGRSYCDYGLYSLFTGGNAQVLSKESIALKIYLGGSTNSTGLASIPQDQISKLREEGFRLVFHAESDECLDRNRREVHSLADHDLSRPEACEKMAVDYVASLKYPDKTVTHISSMASLADIKSRDFKIEATPHHLLLNEAMGLGPKGKVNPPLRSKDTQLSLLEAYAGGRIDVVSSDHAPHTEEDKDGFEYAKSGIIGVETRLPLMLALVKKGIVPMEVFYRTVIENPPANFGIKKGKLEIGYVADFFSVKLSEMQKINENRLHSKNSFSPFDGFDAVFPENVFIRGSPALENGELLSDRQGLFLNDIKGARNA